MTLALLFVAAQASAICLSRPAIVAECRFSILALLVVGRSLTILGAHRDSLDDGNREVARDALGCALLAGLVGGALHILGKVMEAEIRADAPVCVVDAEATTSSKAEEEDSSPAANEPAADERTADAAALLGVSVDATEDDIRAALRARLSSSCLHPDHGGDGEVATLLIAAKNRLIEHVRKSRVVR
jgi:hypothetical protein